ncbi:MAG: phosphoglycerate mutase family protein [Acidipropionibacterium jensenii]|nr:phosphoglycerate mutase family protein [Acidipropionibacterium jensenii]
MHLMLIRHGQSANNALAAQGAEVFGAGRVADPALTELGARQADALAGWIGGVDPRPTRLYCSPMRRTLQTAAPVAEALDLPLEVEDFLYERPGPTEGFGETVRAAPGSPLAELSTITARAVFPGSVTERGWYTGEVETPQQAAARAVRIAAWVREAHAEADCVAIVAHGAIGALILSAIICPGRQETLGGFVAGTEPWWFDLANTSTSMVELMPGDKIEVHWINRVDHLVAAGMVTGASAHATGNPGTR